MLTRLAVTFACVGISLSAHADEKEIKTLDGIWIPQSGELGGAKFPDEMLKTMKLIMKDGTYSVTVGKQDDKGTVKVDTKKKPNEMDIAGTDGPNKGKMFPAIFELDGDTLRICYDLSGKERPTAFKTETGATTLLVVYKRSKN
jgi:uncharacterized protein (TIGR03067 family)